MKVLAINGSPKANGNTAKAIELVGEELKSQGIEVEVLHVGNKAIRGCIGCGKCRETGECIFKDDIVNEYAKKLGDYDGILLGSPVYYSGVAGTMKCFLDRLFYVNGSRGNALRHKVGASLAVVRRTGGIPTTDNLDRYINYCEMFVPTSCYWNVIHGTAPGEVVEDAEGVQIAKVLGKNMAWLLKTVEMGKGQLPLPEKEEKQWTNFVR